MEKIYRPSGSLLISKSGVCQVLRKNNTLPRFNRVVVKSDFNELPVPFEKKPRKKSRAYEV